MLKAGHVVEASPPAAFVRSANPEVREFLAAQFITEESYLQMKAIYEKEQ